jgi:hypothetical protein
VIKGKINATKVIRSLKKSNANIKNEFVHLVERKGKYLTDAINDLITKGISPVFGIRKFQRYSESYNDQIRGRLSFFTTKSKRIFAVMEEGQTKKGKRGVEFTPIKFNKGEVRAKRYLNEGLGYNKKLRPINMTLSGKMLDSLKAGSKRDNAMIWFNDKKAEYHNEGAKLWHGGELPKRRLLPTNPGERFHKNVFKLIRSYVGEAVEKAFKSTFK